MVFNENCRNQETEIHKTSNKHRDHTPGRRPLNHKLTENQKIEREIRFRDYEASQSDYEDSELEEEPVFLSSKF